MQIHFARKILLLSLIFFKTMLQKCQRQKIASFIGHVFELYTYAAMIDKLNQQEKLNRFNGCSKRQPKTPFLALFFLDVRGNASSYPWQQLLTFSTIKYIRQLEYTSLRAVSQLIMRINKPTFAHKLAQLYSKNPKGEP